jgi:hypothetical protein
MRHRNPPTARGEVEMKEFKVEFYDSYHAIGISIAKPDGTRKAFGVHIPNDIAEELQDYFHDRGEYVFVNNFKVENSSK